MRQLIDLVIELPVGERRHVEKLVVVADDSRPDRVLFHLRLDQFLESDLIRKWRIRAVELSNSRKLGWVSGQCRRSVHMKSESVSCGAHRPGRQKACPEGPHGSEWCLR